MKFKHILLAGLTIALFATCSEDFLDVPSKADLTSAVYFKTQSDFVAAVNGIYSPMQDFFDVGQGGGANANNDASPMFQIGDMHSDNGRYLYNPNYRAVNEVPADFTPDATMFSGFWNDFYDWIARANQVLAKIDNPDIVWKNTNVKDNLKGQALFLRAYSYWWLTQLYGDACIHLEPVTSVDQASVPLSPRADIIDIVKSDATEASTLLPGKAAQETGRVTSGAAKMLLAEVAIWEKDYGTAETLLEGLSGEYSLLDNYADVFSTSAENHAEIIFDIQYDKVEAEYSSRFVYSMFPWPLSRDTLEALTGISDAVDLTAGEGYCFPSPDLLDNYEAGDERLAATYKYVTNTNNQRVPMCIKYLHPHQLLARGDDNLHIYRYAEALLYLAEAINEQPGGRQAEAMGYVNQVRARAGLADSPAATQEEVRAAILQERRIELAFEGKRFWDLVRFDMLEPVITAYGAEVRANFAAYYLAGPPAPLAFTDFRTKFNIPDAERLYNSEID